MASGEQQSLAKRHTAVIAAFTARLKALSNPEAAIKEHREDSKWTAKESAFLLSLGLEGPDETTNDSVEAQAIKRCEAAVIDTGGQFVTEHAVVHGELTRSPVVIQVLASGWRDPEVPTAALHLAAQFAEQGTTMVTVAGSPIRTVDDDLGALPEVIHYEKVCAATADVVRELRGSYPQVPLVMWVPGSPKALDLLTELAHHVHGKPKTPAWQIDRQTLARYGSGGEPDALLVPAVAVERVTHHLDRWGEPRSPYQKPPTLDELWRQFRLPIELRRIELAGLNPDGGDALVAVIAAVQRAVQQLVIVSKGTNTAQALNMPSPEQPGGPSGTTPVAGP